MRVRPLLAAGLLVASAGCGAAPFSDGDSDAPKPIGLARLEWVETLPSEGWSEGLDWHEDVLWQAFPHSIREKDPQTGEVTVTHAPPSDYSESVAWKPSDLFNVSFATNKIYRGRKTESGFGWQVIGEVPEVHAWGIAHDGTSLIVTGNGTPFLYWLDPDDGTLLRTVTTPVDDLEDIAWFAGQVWASSYSEYPGQFFRIDPATGAIAHVYELPDPSACDIVDGIAFDTRSRLYVTGKDCPSIWIGEFVWD